MNTVCCVRDWTDLGHGWVLPDNELVLGEAVARHNLAVLLVPQQRRHLRLGVNGIHARASRRVPEANVTVRCASCITENHIRNFASSES